MIQVSNRFRVINVQHNSAKLYKLKFFESHIFLNYTVDSI